MTSYKATEYDFGINKLHLYTEGFVNSKKTSFSRLIRVHVKLKAFLSFILGENRPIIGEREHAELLAALSLVDHIPIFEQDTPEEILKRLQVHVHIKGGDYSVDSLPKARVVEQYGGSVVLIPYISEVVIPAVI